MEVHQAPKQALRKILDDDTNSQFVQISSGRPVTDLNGSRWTTTDPFRTPEDPQSNTLFNLANLAIFSKSRQDQQKISLKSISKLL